MSEEQAVATGTERQVTPPVGSTPTTLRSFIDARIPYKSIARTRRASIWSKAAKYREAHQWLQPSFNTDPERTPHWSDVQFRADDEDAIPTPTQPEIFVHLSNESARLGKPELEPYVRPGGESPDAKDREGAKISERALQDALREMNWDELEADADLHMPLYGQSLYESWWATDSAKTTTVPVTTAKCCPRHPMAMGEMATPEEPVAEEAAEDTPTSTETDPAGLSMAEQTEQAEETAEGATVPDANEGMEAEPEEECDFVTCDTKLSQDDMTKVPTETVTATAERTEAQAGALGDRKLRLDINVCPTCEDHPPLVDYYPSEKEAAGGKDYFGRPLGNQKPLGEWRISVLSPHDLFPQSMGIGIKFEDWQSWTVVEPKPIAWLARHFERGRFVKPEAVSALMEWHPVAGERALYESGDSAIFQDFARLKRYYERPSPDCPLGRAIYMAGDEVLLDTTFRLPSQTKKGEYFDIVHLELVPWEKRPHESWGLSMSELLFSLQDDINLERSLDEDITSRMGSVFWLARNGMNLDASGIEAGGYSGKVIYYDTDPMAPQAAPESIGGETRADTTIKKVEFYIEAMGRISGTNDPESGAPPSGSAWSALALQYLGEKSSERRSNRLRRKRKALERLFTHGLTLMYHRCLEPRKMRFKDSDGKFKERAWQGIEMNGQIRVTIDAESEHDTTLQKEQKLIDAVDKGLYDLTNPSVRDKLREKLELPRNIDGNLDVQRDAASREWCDFRDSDGKDEPIVDQSIDDPGIHHDQHGLDIQSDEFRDLEEAALWKTIYPFIADWKAAFPGLLMQLQALMVNRPPLLEYQILAVWDFMLLQRGIKTAMVPPDQLKALRKVMRFRAHYEAHMFAAELQAMAPAPALAAPGSPETAKGTVPTAGGPPVAGPGAPPPPAPTAPAPAAVM